MNWFLHRANGADWDNLKTDEMNFWQVHASRTRGIVTPANFITVLGFALVIAGLYFLYYGPGTLGLLLVLFGRLGDILDGFVAELTKTKSPLGELLDAAADKVVIMLSLIVVYKLQYVPKVVFLGILAQTLYTGLLALSAKRLRIEIHPSLEGKWSTALAWTSILLYILAAQITSTGLSSYLKLAAAIFYCVFLVLALVTSYGYTKKFLFGKRIPLDK